MEIKVARMIKKAPQGCIPFGYKVRAGKVYQDAAEQKAIDMILDLKSKGLSLRKICHALEAKGIVRRIGSLSWHPQVVSNILRRELKNEG